MLTRLRSIARRQLAWLGRHAIEPLIFWIHRRKEGVEVPVSVHMLVSAETWDAGIMAAISFEHFSGRRWPLFIHEDGTVLPAQRAVIERVLPGVRFVPRSEAEARASVHLSRHPRCLSNRRRHNLFLKFLDFPAYAPLRPLCRSGLGCNFL